MYDYIVSFYLGPRACQKTTESLRRDKFLFVKRHLDFLQSYTKEDMSSSIFIINIDKEKEEQEIRGEIKNILKRYNISCSDLRILFRRNGGYSYGAWNDYITEDCRSKFLKHQDKEYYFCIEDDCIPTDQDFFIPFAKKCNEKTPYVCCVIRPDDGDNKIYGESPWPRHAAISHGCFLKQSCLKIYKKYQSVFNIINAGDPRKHSLGCENQVYFYNYFFKEGFDMTSIASEHKIIYQETYVDQRVTYGNRNGKTLIIPIE